MVTAIHGTYSGVNFVTPVPLSLLSGVETVPLMLVKGTNDMPEGLNIQ